MQTSQANTLSPYDQISAVVNKHTAGNKPLPEKIIVPPELFEEFKTEMEALEYALTIWARPVVKGEIDQTEIIIIPGKKYYKPKKNWWKVFFPWFF